MSKTALIVVLILVIVIIAWLIKTYKNSLIRTANGYELVWGIGPFGQHEYILEYTVTNMIKKLKDSQILFWKFFK